MKVYICPNHCSMSDYKCRCKRCNEWMLEAGDKTEEEINKLSEEITKKSI